MTVLVQHYGWAFLAEAVKDHTIGIVQDERASERDDNLWPVFAVPYSKDPFVVMVGDGAQLALRSISIAQLHASSAHEHRSASI